MKREMEKDHEKIKRSIALALQVFDPRYKHTKSHRKNVEQLEKLYQERENETHRDIQI